jgi:hypothetical protein
MEVQKLAFVVLERGGAITILVARTDALLKSVLAVLLEDLKKGSSFFWQGADNAHIMRLGRYCHRSSLSYFYQLLCLELMVV